MRIGILTPDSPRHNLPAMKISAFHKAQGDSVVFNFPLIKADFTYSSLLFNWTERPLADIEGGPRWPERKLDPEIEVMKPDYSIYPNIDYSLGYTYRACPRTCDFCIVPKQDNSETHQSIWSFHDSKFKKICLLNNNILADIMWRETFEEIFDAGLTYIDEQGFDARLITEESAHYISKLKRDGYLHTAWDYPDHESDVLRGLKCLLDAGIKKVMCYVLIGHTTEAEDLYRVMKLQSIGVDPYVMSLDNTIP